MADSWLKIIEGLYFIEAMFFQTFPRGSNLFQLFSFRRSDVQMNGGNVLERTVATA